MLIRELRLRFYDLLLTTIESQHLDSGYPFVSNVYIEEIKLEILHLKEKFLKRLALDSNDRLVSAYDSVISGMELMMAINFDSPNGDANYESAMQIVLSSLIKLRCNANSGHPSSVDFAYAPEWANHCAIDSCGTEYWYQHEPTFNNGEWVPSENDERGVLRTGRKFEGLQSYDNTLVSRFIK